jgi:hypothetical protein
VVIISIEKIIIIKGKKQIWILINSIYKNHLQIENDLSVFCQNREVFSLIALNFLKQAYGGTIVYKFCDSFVDVNV